MTWSHEREAWAFARGLLVFFLWPLAVVGLFVLALWLAFTDDHPNSTWCGPILTDED